MFLSYPYTSDTNKKLLSEFYVSKKRYVSFSSRALTFLYYLKIFDDAFVHRPDKLHISIHRKKFIADTNTIAI